MNRQDKIYIAGHRGMVGSAILRNLKNKGYDNFVLRTSGELDLRNQQQVQDFFAEQKPDYVFLAAAKVGGIQANNIYRADFLYENLMIQNNVIHQSYVQGVKKLQFLGSSCIYPKMAPQPLKEEYLLTGTLEPTNEPYAIAKIAGIKLCEAYRRAVRLPFHLGNAHQPLRPQRQLRLEQLTRTARPDSQIPRSQGAKCFGGRNLGHRQSQTRVFARG